MAAADYRLMTEATGQRIAAALEALSGFGAYLTTADVVNNLTSTAANKPLSANMGNVLNSAKGGTINSLSSDIEIMDYVNGSYQVALSADSTYLPARWGVLTVLKSGNQYGTFIFVASGDPPRVYVRVAHLINKAWYSGWTELQTNPTS